MSRGAAAVRAEFCRCNDAALSSYAGERAQLYARLKLAGLDEAPVHLALFADRGTAQGHGLGRRTMPEMAEYSAVMAVHTLWLVARAEGLGLMGLDSRSGCREPDPRSPRRLDLLGIFLLRLPPERDGYTRARARGLGTAAALGGIRAASMRLRTIAPRSASLGGAAPGPGDCRSSYRRATRSCRSRARDECRRRASSAPGRWRGR